MKYEKELEADFDIALSEDHIRKKEKRYISMKRQKQHKQRLLYELSHCTGYKPSIWRECIERPKASTKSKAKQIGFCA